MQTSGGTARTTVPPGAAPDAVVVARTLLRAGRLAEAGAVLGSTSAADAHTVTERALGHALRVEMLLARGDLAAAMNAGDALAALLDHPSYAGAVAHHAHGELAAALGELDTALEHYRTVGRLPGPEPRDELIGADPLPWRCGAAVVLLHQGRQGEAARLAQEEVALTTAHGSAYGRALALRTLATADASADRLTVLRRARAELDGLGADRLRAQIDTDLAGLLLLSAGVASTPATEVLSLLRSTEAYAGRQDLRPLQARARRLLGLLGEQPRAVQPDALSALTAGERRVARLAAEGLTNRQIAERLVITVKAVEWHLCHVYRKLGVPSRQHLAATLGAPA